MPGEFTQIKNNVLARNIILLAVVIVVAASGLWWHSVRMSANNVFWGMIDNNLTTSSVTRHVVQNTNGRSLDQYIREQFGATTATESTVVLKQTDSVGESIVKSDTIGTTTNDYSRYTSITTPQKTSSGKPINTNNVIGIWGKSPDAPKGQPANARYLQQNILSIVPYGNFSRQQRQALINQMRSHNVYNLAKGSAKSDKQNGRAVFIYQVSIEPAAYVELMQSYAKALGVGRTILLFN